MWGVALDDRFARRWRHQRSPDPIGWQAGRTRRIVVMEPIREAPTLHEVVRFATQLPPEQARKLLASAHPASLKPEEDAGGAPPALVYVSWAQYLAGTTAEERQTWCRLKARAANRTRLMSGAPDYKITAADIWNVLQAAEGRCEHCGSLALEHRPSGPDGRPAPWAHVGRRIGSLGHRLARFNGGSNNIANLCWSCLWCNTWPTERHPGATDHGGHQPTE